MSIASTDFRRRIESRLTLLYGDDAAAVARRIVELCHLRAVGSQPYGHDSGSLWDERDAVLITYGDQVRDDGEPPLQVLAAVLRDMGLAELLSTVHLLPFFPYSSDDGFSVIDYRQVDPRLGDWGDIERLASGGVAGVEGSEPPARPAGGSHPARPQPPRLMFDLVLNHCSRQNEWFQKYLEGLPPYDGYFIEVDPATDLSMVTRPRSTPLLTPVETSRGTRHVWTTFSDDQIDLNYANPDVLLEMLDVLLLYISRGARIIRLDAIAYLWKQVGTPCIHLPETHAVVKLMRDVVDEVAPGTILLTETNVPHEENISYFGDGDEAHMVYNFSLAPLLLDAFLLQDAEPINRWLAELEPPREGTTYFNFTASHDGVGVRPLEGLVDSARLERLVQAVRERGGLIGTRRNPDGSDSPYELNVTYFSALGPPAVEARLSAQAGLLSPAEGAFGALVEGVGRVETRPPSATELHVRRFLSSQAVMLALRGVPGVYFHSLVGTPNYSEGVAETGRARTINRRKFQRHELYAVLADTSSAQHAVFEGYRRLLEIRRRQPAFHPDAPQSPVETGHPGIVAFSRTSLDGRQRIVVLCNVTRGPVRVDLSGNCDVGTMRDLLQTATVESNAVALPACGTAWLSE